MIPLFRPILPKMETVLSLYESSRRSGRLTNYGPNFELAVETLERSMGGYWLPVSNGTVAIEVMIHVALPHAKRIAIPDFTFAATALAVIRSGRVPVILPCNENLQIDARSAKKRAKEFDAVLGVAPFGYALEHGHAGDIAGSLGKPVVWDMAGAFPMVDPNAACSYSLHAAKSLPVGEGGLVRFTRKRDWESAKRLITFDFDENRVSRSVWGMNGKLDDLHCAMLCAQLSQTQEILDRIERHRMMVDAYQSALSGFCEPVTGHTEGFPSLCVLRGLPSDAIVEEGARRGIVFRKYYSPLLSEMPCFSKYAFDRGLNHDSLSSYLAFPSDVSPDEFESVVNCVLDVCRVRTSGAI